MGYLLHVTRLIVLSLFCVLHALPLWAAEAEQSDGLPQLDVSQFPEQLFWLAITFGLLYVLMANVALPCVAETKGNRHKIIGDEISAAQRASAEAKVAMEAIEKSLSSARASAQAKVSDMLADLSAETAVRQSAQERDLSRKLHSAEAEIAVARESALKSVRGVATELASSIVEKLTGVKMKVSS